MDRRRCLAFLLTVGLVCLLLVLVTVPALGNASMQSVGGMPSIMVDGQPEAPLVFFGNTQFGQDAVAWEEIAKAAQAGFHLHMMMVYPPWFEDFSVVDGRCNAVLDADPAAYMIIQTNVYPTWEWLDDHPDQEYLYADGTTESAAPLASVVSQQWREAAGEQLRLLIQHLRAQSYAPRIVGLFLNYMNTAEWFYWGTSERKYSDYSLANLAGFRTWLSSTYETDVALRAAWHDPLVALATAQIPTPAERDATAAYDFRDPSTSDQKTIDYYRYMAEAMIDAQEHFRQIVREETDGTWLAMHYFGYAYELSNTPFRANYSGHMAYARRSLGSPTLDAAAGPYSYGFRGEGQPGSSHSTQHSWALYNQLYWHEDDTPISYGGVTPENLPMMTELAWRNAARQITFGGGLWWMDWKCEGWWNYQEFWDAVAPLRLVYEDYLLGGDRTLDPEFVIIADPDVFVYLNDTTGLSADAMSTQRLWLEALGAETGSFTAQDLRQPTFPQEHAKLYYFINPYFVDDDYLAWIDENLKRDGNVLVWLYAPGLVTPNGLSDARMQELTGISLRHSTQPLSLRTVITNDTHVATQGLSGLEFGPSDSHNPIVYADAGQVGTTTLGVYRDDPSKIAYCAKDFGTWQSVFVGAGGILYVPVLRGLANLAGVHLYPPVSLWPSYDDGIVASKDFLALHAAGDGTRALVFPEPQAEVVDVLTGSVLATNTATLSLPVTFGNTYLLKLSPRLAAEVVQFDVPEEVEAGQAFAATIEFANRGWDTWSGAGGHAAVSQAPVGNSLWGLVGLGLGVAQTVLPGESCVFALDLVAPAETGIYPCRWRMSELGGHGGFGTAAQAMVTVTPPTCLLTVTADPPGGGTVTGSGAYVSGAVASVTATAAPGWTFLYWTGPVTDPDTAATTVLMDADTTVTAHFAQTWFEDDDPALDYTGTWVDYAHVAASDGHARVCSETGAQVTFAFTGTGISCRTAKGPLMGKAQAWLDGAGPMLIDLYARSLQVVTISKTDLAPGAHTLTIRVSGLKNWRSSGRNVAIDALEILP